MSTYNTKFIDLDLLRLYLEKNGWIKNQSNYEALDIYVENTDVNPFEIVLPKTSSFNKAEYYINDAVNILSIVLDESNERVSKIIRSLDHDLHNFKMETPRDSINLDILENLIRSSKNTIHDAIQIEHSKQYYKSTPKERKIIPNPTLKALDYIKSCRFPHTWHGSFGLTIETPLELQSMGLLNEEGLPETVGRKATYLIYKGLKIFNESVSLNSTDYVFDNFPNLSELQIFKSYNNLLESIGNNSLEFSLNLSPSIQNDRFREANNSKLKIDSKVLYKIERTTNYSKFDEVTKKITFMGFPEAMRSERESLLEESEDAERKVIVKGTSKEINISSINLKLSLDDYKKALQAQQEARYVIIKCSAKKIKKGWEIISVESFDLVKD